MPGSQIQPLSVYISHRKWSVNALFTVSLTVSLYELQAFLRKLKMQYLEQKAKDQYIKTIVSDDAPSINAEDNERLAAANEQKKEKLRIAKSQLAEKDGDIRTLAPLVEQGTSYGATFSRLAHAPGPDYNKAKALTSEASDLARKILDARLQLTRLRQAHPHPRLTVTSANAQLDAQVEEMQKLDDELQGLTATIDEVKDKVKKGARDVERLRIERADTEKLVRAGEADVQDGRVRGLYDWCVGKRWSAEGMLTPQLGLPRHWLCIVPSIRSSPSSRCRRTSFASLILSLPRPG